MIQQNMDWNVLQVTADLNENRFTFNKLNFNFKKQTLKYLLTNLITKEVEEMSESLQSLAKKSIVIY